MQDVNGLKRDFFFRLLEMAGRAYILVRHSEGVAIGRRGFRAEERENGLVLVFNEKMNFIWDDAGITATLVFGGVAEKCFIPAGEIIAVYSPELKVQLLTPGEETPGAEEDGEKRGRDGREEPSEGKVIKVDFRKKGRDG
ncbi:MAG: ClpXP protease specificity-enhancing factor SspB [Nitrospirota bacterium]|jgi:hypothetical protein